MREIMKTKKGILLALGALVVIAVVIILVIIGGKMKEDQEKKEIEQAFQVENLLGRWTAVGEDYSFLIYMDKDLNCHLRINIFYDADSKTNMFDMEANTRVSGFLATESSGSDKITMMVRKRPNNDNNSFEVYFKYMNQGDEITNDNDLENLHLVIQRDTAFDKWVDMATNDYSPALLESIGKLINQSCSNYYGQEISVVDIKAEEDRLAGSSVDYNGFISGSGMIAGVNNSTLQLNTTNIRFEIDPVEKGTLRLYNLSNITKGEDIVLHYNSEK